MEKNGVGIHIGLFRSEGILGQERLFAPLDIYPHVKKKKKKKQDLLCAPALVTARGASTAIFCGKTTYKQECVHMDSELCI